MADLIDRQKALGETWRSPRYTDPLNVLTEIRERLLALPPVDAVEVVRCRDCRYWQDNNGGYPHEECRWGHDETPDADDYCSYGERKEQ